MTQLFERSILLRLGLALVSITLLAFLGMLSSMFIAETSRGDAGAVNTAGSLRMYSYRIATELGQALEADPARYRERLAPLVETFEHRLTGRRLLVAIPQAHDDELRLTYERIVRQWHETMRPRLDLQGDGPPADSAQLERGYLAAVPGFVQDIDGLVKQLELAAEGKIENLRAVQASILFLTLIIVFIAMHLVYTRFLLPLRDLLEFTRHAGRGNLAVRANYTGNDELGRLGHAFNTMAGELSKMYADLESRVREKTEDLERSNRSLELLYKTIKRLNEATPPQEAYGAVLDDIERLVGVGKGAICLGSNGEEPAFQLAASWASTEEDERPHPCRPPQCARCFGDGSTHLLRYWDEAHPEERRVISIPIADRAARYGVLLFDVPGGEGLADWQVELLEAVARHIAIALQVSERSAESRRLALLEERNVIARELHDSLAQSLSYLKIQVARINAALGQAGNEEQVAAIVGELREGLNRAYRQLRELLATFRLKMEGRGLTTALEQAIEEFGKRGGLPIELDNRIGNIQLSPNEEIHVLQVVREALSNIARHAHAGHAVVSLKRTDEGIVEVLVADDGVGIPNESERHHHYGLAIMNERAHSLQGRLTHRQSQLGGTEVCLSFTPALYNPKGGNGD